MPDFDAIVNDPKFLPYHGWHDEYIGKDEYLPASQQVRDEFLALAEVIKFYDLGKKCVQLGLGTVGATHLLFQELFDEVYTIEESNKSIFRLLKRFPESHHIIHANTHDESIIKYMETFAPIDFLFIDAGHMYNDV